MMSTVTLLRAAARFFHWNINTSASEKPTAFPNRSDFPLRRFTSGVCSFLAQVSSVVFDSLSLISDE